MSDLEVTCSRCHSTLHHECHPETLQGAAVDLFMWHPESGFPEKLKKGNPYVDERVDDETIPFFSEAFLYPLLGKGDARTFMSLVRELFRSMGIDPYSLEEKAMEILVQKKRDKEEEQKRRADARERYRQMMLPTLKPLGARVVCVYQSFYCFDVNVHACERGRCFAREGSESGKSKNPSISPVTRTEDGGLEVSCTLCKRTHWATPEQVEGWRSEERYQVRPKSEHRDVEPMKPEDWIAADVVARAFGFKRR
jgi:hypothetical protein